MWRFVFFKNINFVYCITSLTCSYVSCLLPPVGETPIDARVGYWQGMWPCREVHICRKSHQEPIGIKYSLVSLISEEQESVLCT